MRLCEDNLAKEELYFENFLSRYYPWFLCLVPHLFIFDLSPFCDLVVVPLVPGSKSLQKVLVKLGVTADLVHLIDDLVLAHENKETTPNEIGVTGSLAQEEGTLRVLLEKSLDLLHMGLSIVPCLLTALLLVKLIEGLPSHLGAGLLPVGDALFVQDTSRDGGEVDRSEGTHDIRHDTEKLGKDR